MSTDLSLLIRIIHLNRKFFAGMLFGILLIALMAANDDDRG